MHDPLEITLAGGRYDRTFPLIEGRVEAPGVRLRYLPMVIEEVFWRALRHQEFDAAELSLCYYLTLRSKGNTDWIAVPVFPSRFFRHGCVYVPADSTRTSLDDLRGATVGIPEYTMTACVWQRGLLADEHGITPDQIHWRYGGIENPGRRDRVDLAPPDGVDVRPIGADDTLNAMLAEGRVDAVMCPRVPSACRDGRARRLLQDYTRMELDYYERTHVFPPMHVVALRSDVYERNPWAARSLFDAYQEAKRLAYEWLGDINALPISLPWYVDAYERTREVFGDDPWPDGFDANRPALETVSRYLVEQGIADPFDLDDAFAPNTKDRYVI